VRPPCAVILTGNYGEAGAVERYAHTRAYSGHNAYGDWGPPPDGARPVVAVGVDPRTLRGCRAVARIDNRPGVDNEERGEPVYLCDGPRRPWSQAWPALRHLG
jgi:hypothetical protein